MRRQDGRPAEAVVMILRVNAAGKRVGEQLGVVPDSVRSWVQQARIAAGGGRADLLSVR